MSKQETVKWLSLNCLYKFFFTRISSPLISTWVIILLSVVPCFSILIRKQRNLRVVACGIPSSHIPDLLLPSWSELEARSCGQRGRKPLLFVTLAWVMVICRCHQHNLHGWWPEVMVMYIWLCPFSSYSPSDLLRSQACIIQTPSMPHQSLDLVLTAVCLIVWVLGMFCPLRARNTGRTEILFLLSAVCPLALEMPRSGWKPTQ